MTVSPRDADVIRQALEFWAPASDASHPALARLLARVHALERENAELREGSGEMMTAAEVAAQPAPEDADVIRAGIVAQNHRSPGCRCVFCERRADSLAALDRLAARVHALERALGEIADEWEGQMGTGQMLSDLARAVVLEGAAADTEGL